MASTYTPIATTTLSSSASTITFSSIPATYTDLVVVICPVATTDQVNALLMRINSDTATNYSDTNLNGSGSSAGSYRSSSATYINLAESNILGDTTAGQTNFIISIFNYANTTTYKTILCRYNDATTGTGATVGLWRKTPEAITTISFALGASFPTQNLASGSTATLYGIKAA